MHDELQVYLGAIVAATCQIKFDRRSKPILTANSATVSNQQMPVEFKSSFRELHHQWRQPSQLDSS